jgi:transposase-like protein
MKRVWLFLREIEVKLTNGSDVRSACRSVGVSDATYYNWRKRFGGMGKSQLSELRALEKENVLNVISPYAPSSSRTALPR